MLPGTKSKKRGRPIPPEATNTIKMIASYSRHDSDEDEDGIHFLNPAVGAFPPSRVAKKLPIGAKEMPDEKRAAGLKHQPTANLLAMISDSDKTAEILASSSGNLKRTNRCFLRNAAGKARVCVTEMSKRTPLLAARRYWNRRIPYSGTGDKMCKAGE